MAQYFHHCICIARPTKKTKQKNSTSTARLSVLCIETLQKRKKSSVQKLPPPPSQREQLQIMTTRNPSLSNIHTLYIYITCTNTLPHTNIPFKKTTHCIQVVPFTHDSNHTVRIQEGVKTPHVQWYTYGTWFGQTPLASPGLQWKTCAGEKKNNTRPL